MRAVARDGIRLFELVEVDPPGVHYLDWTEFAELARSAHVDPRVVPGRPPSLLQALAPDGYRILPFAGGLYLYRSATPYAERGNSPIGGWADSASRLQFAPESVGAPVVASVLSTLPVADGDEVVRARVVLDLRPSRPPSLAELRTLVLPYVGLRALGAVVLPAALAGALGELANLTEFSDETAIGVFPVDARGTTTFRSAAFEYWFFNAGTHRLSGITLQPYGLTQIQGRAGLYEINREWALETLPGNCCCARPKRRPSCGRRPSRGPPVPRSGSWWPPCACASRMWWSSWPNGSATVCPARPSSTSVTTRPSREEPPAVPVQRASASSVPQWRVEPDGSVSWLDSRPAQGPAITVERGLLAVGSEVHVDPAQHLPAGIAIGSVHDPRVLETALLAGLVEADRDGAEAVVVSLSPLWLRS